MACIDRRVTSPLVNVNMFILLSVSVFVYAKGTQCISHYLAIICCTQMLKLIYQKQKKMKNKKNTLNIHEHIHQVNDQNLRNLSSLKSEIIHETPCNSLQYRLRAGNSSRLLMSRQLQGEIMLHLFFLFRPSYPPSRSASLCLRTNLFESKLNGSRFLSRARKVIVEKYLRKEKRKKKRKKVTLLVVQFFPLSGSTHIAANV